MVKIIFASDLHGNLVQYHSLVNQAITENCEVIMIGGDFLPGKTWKHNEYTRNRMKEIEYSKSVKNQHLYFFTYVYGILERFLNLSKKNRIYITFGNVDFYRIKGILQEEITSRKIERLYFISQSMFPLNEKIDVIGISNTPFKGSGTFDWQRVDGLIDNKPSPELLEKVKNCHGWCSMNEEELKEYGLVLLPEKKSKYECPRVLVPLESAISKYTYEYEFDKMLGTDYEKVKKKLIILSHCPPYDTQNSRKDGEKDSGSVSLRRLIEKISSNVLVFLCGHVHNCIRNQSNITEEFIKTGIGDRISDVPIVSTGNSPYKGEFFFCLVEIDDEDPSKEIKIVRRRVEEKDVRIM